MPYRIDPDAIEGMRQTASLKAEAKRLREERILYYLRQGMALTEVAAAVGCHKGTVSKVRDQYLTAARKGA